MSFPVYDPGVILKEGFSNDISESDHQCYIAELLGDADLYYRDEIDRLENKLFEHNQLKKNLLNIYHAFNNKNILVSNQGQALDGYSALANYQAIIAKLETEKQNE